MNYAQTLNYLFTQIPMFQRIGAAAYNGKLDNTLAICEHLNNPEKKFRSIHIAGTNGKGSTSHYIASILQSAGLKVGLYTSPHLKDFRERIKINGTKISEKKVIDFVAKNKAFFQEKKMSFFEMTVALAFNHFAEEKVDIAVIETGLGGRLDSTNVIQPLCSIITNISFDHAAFLGDSLEKIAFEKAGIIKQNTPIIIGETQEEIKAVFYEVAKQKQANLVFADEIWKAKKMQMLFNKKAYLKIEMLRVGEEIPFKLESELLGRYQSKNLPAVLVLMELLNELGYSIFEKNIEEGIKKVVAKTGLLGRWQVLSEKPLVIADAGHNVAGIKEVLLQIEHTPHEQLHFVLGMVNDKDISAILKLLPKEGHYYFCKSNIPRALPAEELKLLAIKSGLKGETYPTVQEAYKTAKSKANPKDLVLIGGSAFTVAEVV